jgi:hypothetical protein
MRTNFKIALVLVAVAATLAMPIRAAQEKPLKWVSYSGTIISSDGEFDAIRYTFQTNGENNIFGDVVTRVKFCPSDSGFICMYGDAFRFAVPRRILRVGDTWNFAGRTYKLLPSYMVTIPGGRVPNSEKPDWDFQVFKKEFMTYVISLKYKRKDGVACNEIYLFSNQHGLLAMMGSCVEKGVAHSWQNWLEGTDGLGSPAFEKQIPADAFLSKTEAEKLGTQKPLK